jgi:hypothetical protein
LLSNLYRLIVRPKPGALVMQKEKIIVDDKNREKIIDIYCKRLLDDMDFSTLYCFSLHMLKDNKEGLTNKMLEEQIADYYPDLLEN